MKTFSLVAYGSLALALCLWAFLFWGSLHLMASAEDRAQSATQLQADAAKHAYTARLAALAQDTSVQRATLESIVQPDVVTIVNGIEAAGKKANTDAQVTSALADGTATDLPGGGKVQGVAFVVEAHGSFASILKLETMYENLPLASTIESVDLEKAVAQGATAPSWHLTMRIRVFTSASITS